MALGISHHTHWAPVTVTDTCVVFSHSPSSSTYPEITSDAERHEYKREFDADLREYKRLCAEMDDITDRLNKLSRQLDALDDTSAKYQVSSKQSSPPQTGIGMTNLMRSSSESDGAKLQRNATGTPNSAWRWARNTFISVALVICAEIY